MQSSKVQLDSYITHTLFDLKVFEKDKNNTTTNFAGFIEFIRNNGLMPEKPVSTLNSLRKGQITLPVAVRDPNNSNIQYDEMGSKYHFKFFNGTPDILDFQYLYGGEKPTTPVKGGECEAMRILDWHCENRPKAK